MRLPLAVAAFALAVAISPPARADEERRVVLVSMPESVVTATGEALSPWSIPVEASAVMPPASNAEAEAIAHDHAATTVAWLDHGELVIYDDERGVSERHATTVDPLDDVAAASIALSIKAAVRRPTDPPDDTPPIVVVEKPVVIEKPAPRPRFAPHISAHVGGGFPITSSAPAMLRFAGTFSVDLPPVPQLAIAVGVEAGPGATIDSDAMDGQYSDVTFALGVEWRHRVTSRLWLVPALAGTLHVARLQGTSSSGGGGTMRVSESAYPAGARLEIGIEAGRRARVGVAVQGSFLAGAETFKVRSENVLTTPSATLGAVLRISFQ